MVKRETKLRTGERAFAVEKMLFRILGPQEPDIVQVEYDPLPAAQKYATATGGNW